MIAYALLLAFAFCIGAHVGAWAIIAIGRAAEKRVEKERGEL